MPIMYYGSSISENMTETPEGYLICRNVPIGRVGWMTYLGEEIGIEDKEGKEIRVHRSPEELFSKATIASFEGKPVTNNHPIENLSVKTVALVAKGHAENVRPQGDLLLADLFITDEGLISEVRTGKREVSSGYDCLWEPTSDGKYEQREIVGNHIAVVQNGRAGPRVAIKDEATKKIENKEGSVKMSGKINLKTLAALGFKAFAKDAEPEEIAKAMDAFGEEEEKGTKDKKAKDEEPEKKETKDEGSEVVSALKEVKDAMKAVQDTLEKLVKSDKKVHEEAGADAEFEKLEKEVGDEEPEEKKEEAKDAEAEEKETKDAAEVVETKDACKDDDGDDDEDDKKSASDAAFKKLVQDMKPIIMSIPDKNARDAAAAKFAKSVRDARGMKASNGYGAIVTTVAGNKRNTMDEQAQKQQSQQDATAVSCANWNANNAQKTN